jgi:hypothetical protein
MNLVKQSCFTALAVISRAFDYNTIFNNMSTSRVSTEFALLTFSSAASLNLLFSNLSAFPAEPQIIYRIFDVRQINLKFSTEFAFSGCS